MQLVLLGVAAYSVYSSLGTWYRGFIGAKNPFFRHRHSTGLNDLGFISFFLSPCKSEPVHGHRYEGLRLSTLTDLNSQVPDRPSGYQQL